MSPSGKELAGLLPVMAIVGLTTALPAHSIDFDKISSRTTVEDVINSKSVEVSLFSALKVVFRKLNVRTHHNLKSRVAFQLHRGMEVKPLEKKESGGVLWVRIEVGDKSYWVAESDSKYTYLADPTDEDNKDLFKAKETFEGYKIIINKRARILNLLKGNGESWDVVRNYRIGLSYNSSESLLPKREEGDLLTPEGSYYYAYRNPISKFGTDSDTGRGLPSLMISYPNAFDAWRGLQDGQIGLSQYRRIVEAAARKTRTLQNTDLGSFIMIHGGGAEDWTLGCIALNDADMKEFDSMVDAGVPVEIKP